MATPIVNLVRLSPEQYAVLLKKLPSPGCTSDTTAIQAGEQIGIQRVLALLRDGWVIEPA